jgi:hypothetical protein
VDHTLPNVLCTDSIAAGAPRIPMVYARRDRCVMSRGRPGAAGIFVVLSCSCLGER